MDGREDGLDGFGGDAVLTAPLHACMENLLEALGLERRHMVLFLPRTYIFAHAQTL